MLNFPHNIDDMYDIINEPKDITIILTGRQNKKVYLATKKTLASFS